MSSCPVCIEIEAGDVIRQLDGDALAKFGLVKADRAEIAARHETLFAAAERGDCAGMTAAAEGIAWALYGRILTGRAAA